MKRTIFVLIGVLAASAASAQTQQGVWRCMVDPMNRTISPTYIGKLPMGTVVEYALIVDGYKIDGEVRQLDGDSNTVPFGQKVFLDILVENLWIVNRPLQCVVAVKLPAAKGETQVVTTMSSSIATAPMQSMRSVRIRYAYEDGSPATTQFRILNIMGDFGQAPQKVRVEFGYWLFEPYEVSSERLRVNTVSMADFGEAMWPVTVCVADSTTSWRCDTNFAWHYWPQ